MSRLFALPTVAGKSVHELRDSLDGIKQLKADGRWKPYMAMREKNTKPFIAWDGEGWTDQNGEHSYMLLAVSTGEHIAAPRLDTWECLDFILAMGARYKDAIHIIYGGGYDVTHILRDVPFDTRVELREKNVVRIKSRNPDKPNVYTIEYIPHKWFTLTGWDHETRKKVKVQIFDIMTFFQSSALKAWESRGIPIPEEVSSGKASRADFTWDDIDEVRYYCQLELNMYVQLAKALRDEFKDAGLNVNQWHGPGAVASAVFKKYKIQDHMQRPPLPVERALQGAYFGGRFEQFKAGHHEGKVYVYDINSAYPDKIRNLPSLAGAEWEWTDVYDGSPGVWLCSFESGNDISDADIYPIPWRGKTGNVGFPNYVHEVWLWHFEARFATRVKGGFKLKLANDTKPFAFVADMYQKSKEWKATGRGGEKALKLAMNSIYGKTAQRIGGRESNGNVPQWHQLEWAGMITSATRAQIWEAVSQAPESIVAVETDSVASTVPLDLDIGPGLGQWEFTEYDSITYVQSGIYFTEDEVHGGKVRSRGIDVRQLVYDEVMDFLAKNGEGELMVTSHDFIGISNPRTYLYGQWTDSVKQIRIAGGKRVHMVDWCPSCAEGLTMADCAHALVASPHMGRVASTRHPLPWLDNEMIADPEVGRIANEAIRDFEMRVS